MPVVEREPMPVAEHVAIPVVERAADLAVAEHAVASAEAVDSTVVAVATAVADTGNTIEFRGSPQISAEFPDKARLLR